jgi:protein-S-isoprenylcysteine O-methyltransferase Ste14
MKRYLFFIYGVTGHATFLGLFAYLAGFLFNVFVPKSIDSGPAGRTAEAVVIDVLLIAAFGLQHSVMARPGFKAAWTRIVPEPIERSTYVWISNVLLALLMWQWRPIDFVIWDLSGGGGRAVLSTLFVGGCLLVPLASFMIDHFDLFGTRQVWLNLRRKAYRSLPFHTPGLYRWVRHPLYVGWITFFWATPIMTAGHLLFAGTMTAYIMIAVFFEERDLVRVYGEKYIGYRRQVPGFIPRLRGTGGRRTAGAQADIASTRTATPTASLLSTSSTDRTG